MASRPAAWLKFYFRIVTPSGLIRLCAFVCLFASAGAYAQVPTDAGGLVIFEAESYTANLSRRSSQSWSSCTSVASYSGSGYMEAWPNDGTNLTTASSANPELNGQLQLNFTRPANRSAVETSLDLTNWDLWDMPGNAPTYPAANQPRSLPISLDSRG